MHIAFVVHRFPALSETFILNQIVGLIELGHEVDIYAERVGDTQLLHDNVVKYGLLDRLHYLPDFPYHPSSKKATIRNFCALFIQTIVLLLSSPLLFVRLITAKPVDFTTLMLRLSYARLPSLRKSRYDIIHCHFAYMGDAGLALRQINSAKGKVITTFHGHDVNVKDIAAARQKYKRVFKFGDYFTSNTNFTANQAIALGCPKEKIAILPVGLDLSQYPFREATYPESGKVNVLTVARLVEKKGIEYSIKAVSKALKLYPNISYSIVGNGYLKRDLEELVAQLGIAKNVSFLGWKNQDEIVELYQKSHLFVLPSVTAANGDKEGQGLVLQEAQAIGLPVLSTWHNGIPDGVLDGESGFLVPEKDVEALAEKLIYLISSPGIWAKFSRAGRRHIEKNYHIDDLNLKLIDIYKLSNKSKLLRSR